MWSNFVKSRNTVDGKRSRIRRKMEFSDHFNVPGRTVKLLPFGNQLLLILPITIVVLFIILELMKDSFGPDKDNWLIASESGSHETFHIPDMNDILLWGFNGRAVQLNISRLCTSHQEEYAEGYNKYNLNKYLSDRISMRRSLPDVRSQECREVSRDLSRLPNVSVVVVFGNEPRTTLLRMLFSILDRSPLELIQEIVLVDNNSDVEELQFPRLEHYLSGFKKVSVVRLSTFHGAAQARLQGARRVTSDVIVFLQPRCECTEGWLVPLLEWIALNRSTIAVPIVDRIDLDTFQYVTEPLSEVKVGSFTWELTTNRRLLTKPLVNATQSVPIPVIADGIFAVGRDYLIKLGGFDKGLIAENSVNIEFSFRSWLCGGQILLVPCSHVGYIFPLSHVQKPDMLSSEAIQDRRRISDKWMGSYRYFVYERLQQYSHEKVWQPDLLNAQSNMPTPDARCNSFEWYLQTVEPAMYFPETIERRGRLVVTSTSSTILSLGVKDNKVVLQDWISSPETFWYHLKSGILVTENRTCLSYAQDKITAEKRRQQNSSVIANFRRNRRDLYKRQQFLELVPRGDETTAVKQMAPNIPLPVSPQDKLKETEPQMSPKQRLQRHGLNYLREDSVVKNYDIYDNEVQIKLNQRKMNLGEILQLVDSGSHYAESENPSEPNTKSQYASVTGSAVQTQTSDSSRLQVQGQPSSLTLKPGTESVSFSDLIVQPCDNKDNEEQWMYSEAKTLLHIKSGLCMVAQESRFGKYFLGMVRCDSRSMAHQWSFVNKLVSD